MELVLWGTNGSLKVSILKELPGQLGRCGGNKVLGENADTDTLH